MGGTAANGGSRMIDRKASTIQELFRQGHFFFFTVLIFSPILQQYWRVFFKIIFYKYISFTLLILWYLFSTQNIDCPELFSVW